MRELFSACTPARAPIALQLVRWRYIRGTRQGCGPPNPLPMRPPGTDNAGEPYPKADLAGWRPLCHLQLSTPVGSPLARTVSSCILPSLLHEDSISQHGNAFTGPALLELCQMVLHDVHGSLRASGQRNGTAVACRRKNACE